jgi:hypothetical protein
MKKSFIIFIAVVFASAGLSSCKSHERCAAYGKVNKIDVQKSLSDKTARSL